MLLLRILVCTLVINVQHQRVPLLGSEGFPCSVSRGQRLSPSSFDGQQVLVCSSGRKTRIEDETVETTSTARSQKGSENPTFVRA